MIKLSNILTEVLNTFQVECELLTDPKFNVTDLLKIKFVTREEPKSDLESFKKDILTSDMEDNDLRIPGAKSVTFKTETLKRL